MPIAREGKGGGIRPESFAKYTMPNNIFPPLFDVVKLDVPDRFPTGIRTTTIANPFFVDQAFKRYLGDPEYYDWPSKIMRGHYDTVKRALDRNGITIKYISAATWKSAYSDANLTSFVVATDGDFLWEKYEGNTPGGGQNRIYLQGKMIKLTSFVSMADDVQDQLLQPEQELTPSPYADDPPAFMKSARGFARNPAVAPYDPRFEVLYAGTAEGFVDELVPLFQHDYTLKDTAERLEKFRKQGYTPTYIALRISIDERTWAKLGSPTVLKDVLPRPTKDFWIGTDIIIAVRNEKQGQGALFVRTGYDPKVFWDRDAGLPKIPKTKKK